MFIKICGLSTAKTLQAAVKAGADAVGFVLAPGYARSVSPEDVRELVSGLPSHIETVAVFRNQPIDVVVSQAAQAHVATVQLHGEESLADVEAVEARGFGVLRAFPAQHFAAFTPAQRAWWARRRILLDAVNPGEGKPFDSIVLKDHRPEGFWLLAGGLTPTNVGELVAQTRPDGVDVSSGVEVSRGVKSVELIEEFISTVRGLPPATTAT